MVAPERTVKFPLTKLPVVALIMLPVIVAPLNEVIKIPVGAATRPKLPDAPVIVTPEMLVVP